MITITKHKDGTVTYDGKLNDAQILIIGQWIADKYLQKETGEKSVPAEAV